MDEFAKLEYQTLRKEIEESKQRLFLVVAAGISVVTTADYFAVRDNAGIFSLLLPFLVLAFALLFLSQHNAKFRAGRYIRKHIEHNLKGIAPGWENWLEKDVVKHREPDKYIKMGFLVVFVTYYSFSAYLAGKSLDSLLIIWGIDVKYLTWILFGVVGIIFIYYLVSRSATSTD